MAQKGKSACSKLQNGYMKSMPEFQPRSLTPKSVLFLPLAVPHMELWGFSMEMNNESVK
jgi:hypothetical protein